MKTMARLKYVFPGTLTWRDSVNSGWQRERIRTDINMSWEQHTDRKGNAAYGETEKETVSESEMEPSLGDGRCTPPSFPSQCVPCQRGLWWPGFVCRHLAPVPDTSTLVWQEATLQLAHLTMAVWGGGVCFREWGLLMMQSSCACVRAFGSLHCILYFSARW